MSLELGRKLSELDMVDMTGIYDVHTFKFNYLKFYRRNSST